MSSMSYMSTLKVLKVLVMIVEGTAYTVREGQIGQRAKGYKGPYCPGTCVVAIAGGVAVTTSTQLTQPCPLSPFPTRVMHMALHGNHRPFPSS